MAVLEARAIGVDPHPLTRKQGTLLTQIKGGRDELAFEGDRAEVVRHNNTVRHFRGELGSTPCLCGNCGTRRLTRFDKGNAILINPAPHFALGLMPVATTMQWPPDEASLDSQVPTEMAAHLPWSIAKRFYGAQLGIMKAAQELALQYPEAQLVPVSILHHAEEVSRAQTEKERSEGYGRTGERFRTLAAAHANTGALDQSVIIMPRRKPVEPAIQVERQRLTRRVTSAMGRLVRDEVRGALEEQDMNPHAIEVYSRDMDAPPVGYEIVFNGITSENLTDVDSIELVTAAAQAEWWAYGAALDQVEGSLPQDYFDFDGQRLGRLPILASRSYLFLGQHPSTGDEVLKLATGPGLFDGRDGGMAAALLDLSKSTKHPAYPAERVDRFHDLATQEVENVVYQLG